MTLFNIFANLFHVWLNRKQLNFISASAFNLLWYVTLVEDKENLASFGYAIGKGRSHKSPKRVLGCQGFSDHTLRTNDLAPPEYYSIFPHKEASPLVWEFWPQASFEKTEARKRPYGKRVILKVWDEAQSSDRNFCSKPSWPKCQWNIAQKTH